MIQQEVMSALAVAAHVADGRVFPKIAPNNAQTPYVVYARISSAPENTLANGAPIDNVRLQLDCFDTTYAGAVAVAVAKAVKAALAASAITHLLLLEQGQFEPEALLHRVILDFSIWH